MNKIKKLISMTLVVVLLSSGCASLRSFERYEYKTLEHRLLAVGLEPDKSKDPATAGALNLLPGFGNAYLGQWGLFAINLLLWPWSAIWGIPQVIHDAEVINKQETIYFYKFGPGNGLLLEMEKEMNITS